MVKWAYDKGIMNGQSSRTFSPDVMVNRGMACTILYRFAGLETDGDNGAASPFPDVPRDAYYGPAVAWAAGENIVQGYDDGLFHHPGATGGDFVPLRFVLRRAKRHEPRTGQL